MLKLYTHYNNNNNNNNNNNIFFMPQVQMIPGDPQNRAQ